MADDDDGHFLRVRPDWLARRVEDILEPDLPIIDPHHHLWDFPEWRYLFADLLADLQSGHNIRQTVFVQCFAMYRADGPRELRSLGETEFVNGVAAMSASGGYGDVRACAGIVGMVDLRLGKEAADVLSRHVAAGGGRFKGVRQIAAWDADERIRSASRAPPPDLFQQPEFRQGFLLSRSRRSFVRCVGVPHPARSGSRSGARLSRNANCSRSRRRADRHRPLRGTTRRGLCRLVPGDRPHRRLRQRRRQARRPCHAARRLQLPSRRRAAAHPRSLPPPGAPTSTVASNPSDPTAACSKAIFRSTRGVAATRCFGMRSSAWRRAILPRRRPRCSAKPHARLIVYRRTEAAAAPPRRLHAPFLT